MSIGDEQVFVTWQRGLVARGKADIAWVDKAALLNGQMPAITKHFIDRIDGQDNSLNRVLGCFDMYDQPSPSVAYFIADSHTDSGINNWVRLYALDANSGQPPHEFDLIVPDYKTAPGLVLRAEGMANCKPYFKFGAYRNGSAWVAHSIGDDEPNTASVRWYEIAMNDWPLSGQNPTLVQSGTIDPVSPAGDTASAIYPAIHVDDSGNAMIAYNECSATDHISVRRQIRKHYDSLGTLRAPLTVRESTASPPTNYAWADYSDMAWDPDPLSSGGVMWGHLQWYGVNPDSDPPDLIDKRRTSVFRTDLFKSLTLDITPATPIQRDVTPVHLEIHGAAPGGLVKWYYSNVGCGASIIPFYNVTLEIEDAIFLAQAVTDSNGTAVKNFVVPPSFPLGDVWVQCAELENTSEVLKRVIVE